MKKWYQYDVLTAGYEEAVAERSEWEQEYRNISDFLLPGRGVYDRYSKPRKRKLTTNRVINSMAEDSLYVLTSGMHGGLTSPSRPWFTLGWKDSKLDDLEPLKAWLQQCELILHAGLQMSNFYSVVNSFYIEYAGYGTATTYVGHDSGQDGVPFRFELLTAGEYAFVMGADGRPSRFYRTIFMSQRQAYERVGKKCSDSIVNAVTKSQAGIDKITVTILEVVARERNGEFPYARVFYEQTGGATARNDASKEPLELSGFMEFPYPLARWSTIGSDTYGIGPGSRSLQDIKRLQEMEKALLMAAHKSVNPPLNAPARMRGKLNTLPGGKNFYANPSETVNEVYQVRFDFNGVSGVIERVEQRIQRNFFNDIFLTASRDPNASPLKATQVNVQEQEKMLRLGPVIERLQHEYLQPVIERCFNIMLRKGMFPELTPDLAEMAGDYKITLISPLATAQRSIALQAIQSFMGFIGQAAQFDQTILDNIDVDAAAREYADITGVHIGVLRAQEAVDQMRAQRAEQQKQQQAKEEAMVQSQMQAEQGVQGADAQLKQSQAGLNLVEGQATVAETGML
jgi:hypothetical protein